MELLTAMHRVDRVGALVRDVKVNRSQVDGLGAAQLIEAAVPCDPVQPGTQADRAVVGKDRFVCRYEHVLQDVLGGVTRPEQVVAEPDQARPIAVHQRFERSMIAAPDMGDQSLIGLKSEQGQAPPSAAGGRVLAG